MAPLPPVSSGFTGAGSTVPAAFAGQKAERGGRFLGKVGGLDEVFLEGLNGWLVCWLLVFSCLF